MRRRNLNKLKPIDLKDKKYLNFQNYNSINFTPKPQNPKTPEVAYVNDLTNMNKFYALSALAFVGSEAKINACGFNDFQLGWKAFN